MKEIDLRDALDIKELLSKMEKVFSLPWVIAVGKIILIIVIGFVCIKILKHFMSYCRKIDIDIRILLPVERLLKAIIILLLFAVGLSSLGINFEGAWTFLTSFLALIAIGFIAVWSVLSNFVCALLILVLKPFKIGDEISLPEEAIAGKVVDLSLAYTTLVGNDNLYYRIPNNFFFQKSIILHSGYTRSQYGYTRSKH